MYHFIISRMCNEYNVLSTYPQFFLYPHYLVPEYPAGSIFSIRDGGVVVERIGRPRHSGVLNKPRELLPAQKTEDPIDFACVGPSTRHFGPVSARVIKKNN